MKALLLSLVFFASVSANATSLKPGFSLTLPKVIEAGKVTGNVARVSVDLAENVITVQIFNDRCGQLLPSTPGMIKCMAAAQLVEEYTVPVVDVRQSCGSVIYSGGKDDTTVDGLKVDIEVADHSRRICMDYVAQYSGAEMRIEATRLQLIREVKMLHKHGF